MKRALRYTLFGAMMLAGSAYAESPAKIEPLIGQYTTYRAQKGDTLYTIARHHDVGAILLARVNHLKRPRIKPGQTLILPTVHVLPRNPGTGIVLNIPERAVYVFKDGQLVGRHAVAVGQAGWQTAQGQFKLREKVANPSWKPTKEMVAREGIKDDLVPAGPENPVGDRWMGWSVKGFGFHSTNAPQSVGKAASHGCVRLYPEAAHAMFDEVTVGMPILSVYEPVLIGERDGKFYLSVFPDIYHSGETSLAHVQKILEHRGLDGLVDEKTLAKIVHDADGFPQRIIGADEPLIVNGKPLATAIAPTRVNGSWVVPVREVAQGLGGTVAAQPGGIEITAGGHTLTLKAGKAEAGLDRSSVHLTARPTVVGGTLMAPLQPLMKLFNAQVAFEKGKALMLTSDAAPATKAARTVRVGSDRVKETEQNANDRVGRP